VGIPKEMLTDQGNNFMSELMREVCRLLQISRLRTSPYHGSSISGILISGARGTLPFAEPIWQSGQDLQYSDISLNIPVQKKCCIILSLVFLFPR
jgi:hypothetical protein